MGIPHGYVDEVQASFLLGVSLKTLQQWRIIGRELKFKRHDKHYIYHLEDIQEFEQTRLCIMPATKEKNNGK